VRREYVEIRKAGTERSFNLVRRNSGKEKAFEKGRGVLGARE
jgi:hypothetical protein